MTYRQLSDKITQFFYPPEVVHQNFNLNFYFSPDNVQHFLENYSHFDRHFSILHIPTFDVARTYTGLLTLMCCVGACYSDRVSAAQVRELVCFLKAALDRDPRLLAALHNSANNTDSVEELQSLILLHVLLVWNGDPASRQSSRQVFSHIVSLTRKVNLLRVSDGAAALYSPLHQPNFTPASLDPSRFDWRAFIEQEKRIRVMHFVFLMDVAGSLYFNIPPAFDYKELAIPLPCDDAAFDATDAGSCAEALGLYGPEAAKARNPDGTQRPSQPWLAPVVDALLHPSYKIQTGTTNLLGKFIIMHALLALIRQAQVEGSLAVKYSPMPQHDWLVNAGQNVKSDPASANNSGRNTPIHGIPPHTLHAIRTALEKFKRNWDYDYMTQFPPAAQLHRRYGFSKNAIPFYFVGQYLMKSSNMGDFELPSEQRFVQVINLVKSAQSWVKTDGVSGGDELGPVAEIHKDYGLHDLTLDMAKVFRPLPRVVASTASIKLSGDSSRVKREAT